MKLSNKKLYILLTAFLIVFLLVSGFVFSIYKSMLIKIRYENLRGLAIALAVYRNDNDDMLPEIDQWCEKLTAEADCDPKSFQGLLESQEGVCGYALNENLEGLKFSELPGKVVLVFEAKGSWNLSGGAELAKQTRHKDIAVIFVDGFVNFVTIDEIDTLKWKP